jgi:hypothetical protein
MPMSSFSPDPTTKGREAVIPTAGVDNVSYVGACWLTAQATHQDVWTKICYSRAGDADGCTAVFTIHNDDDSHTDYTFTFECRLNEPYGYVKREGNKYYVGNYTKYATAPV